MLDQLYSMVVFRVVREAIYLLLAEYRGSFPVYLGSPIGNITALFVVPLDIVTGGFSCSGDFSGGFAGGISLGIALVLCLPELSFSEQFDEIPHRISHGNG
jgi:hypothetical protein